MKIIIPLLFLGVFLATPAAAQYQQPKCIKGLTELARDLKVKPSLSNFGLKDCKGEEYDAVGLIQALVTQMKGFKKEFEGMKKAVAVPMPLARPTPLNCSGINC